MKKAYEKPILYAESFELMEHVAGDCAVNDGFAGAHWRDPGSCRYDLIAEGGAATGQALFYSSGNGCDMDLFT
ncbi:MAG: hypothetical protein IJQ00_03320, partial [Kiritimatiellae bacterium]|nr:hypothetical protein [Kiritimatiellia bacterium]